MKLSPYAHIFVTFLDQFNLFLGYFQPIVTLFFVSVRKQFQILRDGVLAVSRMKLDFQIENWNSKISIGKAKVLVIRYLLDDNRIVFHILQYLLILGPVVNLFQPFCLFSVSEHWNGSLKSFARIRRRYNYTWIYFFGKSQIIIKDQNYLGNITCCGNELRFMGNEKQCYR